MSDSIAHIHDPGLAFGSPTRPTAVSRPVEVGYNGQTETWTMSLAQGIGDELGLRDYLDPGDAVLRCLLDHLAASSSQHGGVRVYAGKGDASAS